MTADRRTRFEVLAREVGEPLRRYAARRVGHDLAQDVVADTLLVIWRRLDDVPATEPLPWCYGVARLCVSNALRTRRRERHLFARIVHLDPPAEGYQPEDADDPQLHEALARLSDGDREVLRLWAWESLTPAEVGVALDISANAASIRLHRARKRLAEQLATGAGKIGTAPGQEEIKEGRAP